MVAVDRIAQGDAADLEAIGGRGSLLGAVLGAFLVNGAKSVFTAYFAEYWLFFLGAMFVLVPLLLPHGVMGLLRSLGKKATTGGDV